MRRPGPEASLRHLQGAFARAVMRPFDGNEKRSAAEMDATFIRPNDRLDSSERLDIYHRQYWFRLIDSLREDFPALQAILGEERFQDLAVAYLAKYPSRSFTLRNLGDRLELFLTENPQWVTPHEKLARDVVRLEWAHIVAFDSGALPPIGLDDLLGCDPARLRLAFQPHVTFLECDYAVDEFALAIRRREFGATETSNAVTEKSPTEVAPIPTLPRPENIWLAVHRMENLVYYKRLDRDAYQVLTALHRGTTVTEACEKVSLRRVADPSFIATLQDWFAHWAALGWLCPSPQDQAQSEPGEHQSGAK